MVGMVAWRVSVYRASCRDISILSSLPSDWRLEGADPAQHIDPAGHSLLFTYSTIFKLKIHSDVAWLNDFTIILRICKAICIFPWLNAARYCVDPNTCAAWDSAHSSWALSAIALCQNKQNALLLTFYSLKIYKIKIKITNQPSRITTGT